MMTRRTFVRATSGLLGLIAPSRGLWAADVPAASTPPGPPAPPRIGKSTRVADIAALEPAQVLTASAKTCKMLQFTDFHFFRVTAAEDEQTVADCRRNIDRHQPDFVIASGDLWHDNPQGKGQGYLEFALKHFTSWGVPWAICWGNHDLLDDYQKGHDMLESADRSLYRGGANHGDYRLEVRAPGAPPSSAPVLDVFFLNTNDEGLGPWQIDALQRMTTHVASRRPKPAPALLFFHVPLLDYETRIKADTFTGIKLEGVSRYKENGAAFPVITAPKTIRACFCGHNHVNDYVIKAPGVDLHYGRSTGYAGYGGEKLRKGAKLIEVDLATGAYQQTTVFADGSKPVGWRKARAGAAVV
jgi:hypothetical protein